VPGGFSCFALIACSPLSALLVIISVYALIYLNRLNDPNHRGLETDIPVMTNSKKMIDVILAQKLYA
jgi:hypothetical protein